MKLGKYVLTLVAKIAFSPALEKWITFNWSIHRQKRKQQQELISLSEVCVVAMIVVHFDIKCK